nr:MAG TPA: hypothetical protein [Caudoviricetes sp.]DAV90063.1 MAG TPA: hypothetical protein [Caudoviricetes sp.]
MSRTFFGLSEIFFLTIRNFYIIINIRKEAFIYDFW